MTLSERLRLAKQDRFWPATVELPSGEIVLAEQVEDYLVPQEFPCESSAKEAAAWQVPAIGPDWKPCVWQYDGAFYVRFSARD